MTDACGAISQRNEGSQGPLFHRPTTSCFRSSSNPTVTSSPPLIPTLVYLTFKREVARMPSDLYPPHSLHQPAGLPNPIQRHCWPRPYLGLAWSLQLILKRWRLQQEGATWACTRESRFSRVSGPRSAKGSDWYSRVGPSEDSGRPVKAASSKFSAIWM